MKEANGAQPSKKDFLKALDSRFRVVVDNEAQIDLVLERIDESPPHPDFESFVLIFRAPNDVQAQQGTYRLLHSELGELDIFLVPVKKDDKGLYLEAVFNRAVI